jgi:hypothetical protein
VLRLTGLPATGRCPHATVRRAGRLIELRFLGPECDQGLDVDLDLVGPDADAETEELRLLVQLEGMGYEVRRLPADPDAL